MSTNRSMHWDVDVETGPGMVTKLWFFGYVLPSRDLSPTCRLSLEVLLTEDGRIDMSSCPHWGVEAFFGGSIVEWEEVPVGAGDAQLFQRTNLRSQVVRLNEAREARLEEVLTQAWLIHGHV